MKQSYYSSGMFRIFQHFGILLIFLALLNSCSSELEDFSSELKDDNVTPVSIKDESVLRFKTIDELENISIKDIPGDNDGFELKELSYECVDTIELRALRFDVKAKLASSSKQEKIIYFAAEVGPELVSVEYYPGGEVVPAHDNMMTAFYPKVERYRNYSDGSRIGPDKFYDLGHFQTIGIRPCIYTFMNPSIVNYNDNVIPYFIDGDVNPDYSYYENGVFHYKEKCLIEHNLNTTLIEDNGSIFRGEDFFNIIPYNEMYDEPFFRESSLQMIGNYSMFEEGGNYIESHIYDDLGDIELLNLCSNVPDVSPKPFPKNTTSQKEGWYFGGFYDQNLGCGHLLPRFHINMDRLFLFYGVTLDCYVEVDLQYLVIDNRIIHFDDFALNEYCGIRNINPRQAITKTSDGYLVTIEQELKLYGERFKAILEIEMKGVSGPEETVDNGSYGLIEYEDRNELNQLNSQTETTRCGHSAEKSKRQDGKRISIDRTLPNSLRSIHKTRTIISTDR